MRATCTKIVFLLFIALGFSIHSTAQVVWKKVIGYGNDTSDVANDVYVNPDGTIIVAGYGSAGIVMKLDTAGTTVWKTYIPNTVEIATVIAFDDTSYLCVGYGVSVDTTTGNHWGSSDAVLVRISRNGAVLWKKYFGGSKPELGVDAVKTTDGGFAVLSSTYSTDGQLSGAAPLSSLEFTNAWIFKISPAGNLLWQKSLDYLDSSFNDKAQRVLLANDQQLFVYAAPGAYVVDQNTGASSYFNYSYNGQPGNLNAVYGTVCKNENGDGYLFAYGDYAALEGGSIYIKKLSAAGTLLGTDTVAPFLLTNSVGPHGLISLPGGGYFCAGATDEPSFPVVPELTNGYIYNSYTKQIATVSGPYYEGFNSVKPLPGGEGLIAVGYSSEVVFDPNTGTDTYPRNIWAVKINFNNVIRGNVFIDGNNNNIQDGAETGLRNTTVTTRSLTEQLTTQPFAGDGNYSFNTGRGNYTTKVQLQRPYYTVVPDSINTSFTGNYLLGIANFALHPINGIKDYTVDVSPTNRLRPGFDHYHRITCTNNGTDTLHNRNLVFVKDHRFGFVTAVPSPASVSGDSIMWNIPDLYPNASTDIFLKLVTGIIPQVNIGDTLRSSVYLDSTNDVASADNLVQLSEIVSGSYDPNDKQENYAGNMPVKDIVDGKSLDYLIRFQNTGTDTAFTIVVKDTLDAQLDASAFTMLDASHTYQLSIKDGKYITWTFKDIKLVDSFDNEPLSHGYISYRIKPKLPIGIGDVISNRAAIYFDFNPAIYTNNQQTKIGGPAIPSTWTGAVSVAWEDPLNWNTHKVPDVNTAVIIPAAVAHFPEINSNASCYSLQADPSVTVLVRAGFKLNVAGKNN